MALTYLPDLPLLNIFNRLPTWKLLQLSKLCHRLNNIKREVFQKQTQLRLLGGCRTTKRKLEFLKKLIHSLDVDQNEIGFNFDLILKFDNPRNYAEIGDGQKIELSHDMNVHSLEHIMGLAQMFPNLKRLVVAFTSDCENRFMGQLLRNWPNLTHLDFMDLQNDRRDSLNYDNVIIAINNLHNLKVLAIRFQEPHMFSTRIWPLKLLEPLLQNATKMHTLYFRVGHLTRIVDRLFDYRNPFNHRLNTSVQIPFDRFERFGMIFDYWLEKDHPAISDQLLSKTTRLEVNLIHSAIRHLTNWSALQYLSLRVGTIKDNSLSHLFNSLVGLFNLHEFYLFMNKINATFCIPLESRARQLPQLSSVRRFELCSVTSPYELYRFKWALPNVAALRLRLTSSYELTACDDFESFISFIEYDDLLPESCIVDMKRAFLTYGSDIQHFYWIYYRNGRKEDGVAQLVMLVERCTKMIAGTKRLNFDLEEIEL